MVSVSCVVRQSGLFQHRAYELRVVYTESTASLDPQTRDLLSGFSGGWFEAPGEQR